MKKYREDLNRHSSDECRSIPGTESVAPSDASFVSASLKEVGKARNRIKQLTVHENKSAVGDAHARIIKGVAKVTASTKVRKARLTPRGGHLSTCGWWARPIN